MLKIKNKNLFSIQTSEGRILYRFEKDGFCFYSVKTMKFFFLDKITGIILLNHYDVLDKQSLQIEIEKILGYSINDVFEGITDHYLKSIPKILLIS